MTVSEFSEEDQKKYKKLAKANDLGIKLVFKKRYLLENKAYVPEDNEQDMSEGEGGSGEDGMSDNGEEEKGRTTSSRSKSRGATPANAANAKKAAASKAAELDTWYLVCDSKKDQEDCLEALIISAKALNARYVQDPKNEVAQRILAKKQQKNLSRSRVLDQDEEDSQSNHHLDNNDHLIQKKGVVSPAKPLKKGGEKSAQQIPMFKNQKAAPQRESRSDSNFSDLNQVLQ